MVKLRQSFEKFLESKKWRGLGLVELKFGQDPLCPHLERWCRFKCWEAKDQKNDTGLVFVCATRNEIDKSRTANTDGFVMRFPPNCSCDRIKNFWFDAWESMRPKPSNKDTEEKRHWDEQKVKAKDKFSWKGH